MKSPCENCTQVENPAECEKRACAIWRTWFVRAWDRTRISVLLKALGIKEDNEHSVKC